MLLGWGRTPFIFNKSEQCVKERLTSATKHLKYYKHQSLSMLRMIFNYQEKWNNSEIYHSFFFFNLFKDYLFIYLFNLAAPGLICGTQDLVPRPGIELGPPAWGAWILTHWTTREVPYHGFFFIIIINLFLSFWLLWVFVAACRLSLVAASRGYSSLWCTGFSLRWLLLLWSTGSRRTGSVVVAHGLSSSVTCGIFPNQGSNTCPLHWQADS